MTCIVRLRKILRYLFIAAAAGGVTSAPVLSQQLEVVDANGMKVGDVDSIQLFSPIVAFNLDGRWFSLGILENGFASTAQLSFESVNCSGTPLLSDFAAALGGPPLFSPSAIAPPGNTVFLPIPNTTSEPRTLNSVSDSEGTCMPLSQPVEARVFPAQAIEDLSLRFTSPFKLQATTP